MKRLKVLTKLQEIHLLVFFISCFTALETPSINTLQSSNDFKNLSNSFEINKVNPFPALTVPFSPIFLLKLFIAFELLTNTGKVSLAKGIAIFVSAFLPKFLNQEQKIHLIELF